MLLKKQGLINLLAANDNVYDTVGLSVPANGIPNDLNRQVGEAIVKGAIAYGDWGAANDNHWRLIA